MIAQGVQQRGVYAARCYHRLEAVNETARQRAINMVAIKVNHAQCKTKPGELSKRRLSKLGAAAWGEQCHGWHALRVSREPSSPGIVSVEESYARG